MSRSLLLLCSVLVLAALAYAEPQRSTSAAGLGGACGGDRDCQVGLECSFVPGVMQGQCSAVCNATAACQEQFGAESVCLGADMCARTCRIDADCPAGGLCNAYAWCEQP